MPARSSTRIFVASPFRYPITRIAALLAAALCLPTAAHADGMTPATSVVIVNEADGEASIKVTNTDKTLALLHVGLEDTPEDKEPLLFVTPNLARVEAGKQQLVRFVLATAEPLKVQRLKRVTFEGIPQTAAAKPGTARIGVTVRQNLPVIIHPKGLAPNREPWTDLTWTVKGDELHLDNKTPYVVRMSQEVRVLPAEKATMFSRTYILPGEHMSAKLPEGSGNVTGVRVFPATVYGFSVDSYDARLATHAAP